MLLLRILTSLLKVLANNIAAKTCNIVCLDKLHDKPYLEVSS